MKPRNHTLAIGIVLCSAGLATLWRGIAHPGSEQQFQDFLAGAVGLGSGIGALGLAEGWFEPPFRTFKPSTYYVLSAVCAAGVGLFVWFYALHQIGGWDLGLLIDVGWRTHSGQVPYVDFPMAFPVFFALGAKLAFALFGVHWSSFGAVNVLYAVGTFLWSVWLLTELFGRRWINLLFAVYLQSQTTAMTAYWWYGTITAVACVLYLLSAVWWLQVPASLPAAASYFVSLVLLAGMRPNSAGTFILVVSAVLFFAPKLRFKLVVVSAVAFAAFVGILRWNGIGLTPMIHGYLGVSGRLFSLSHFIVLGYTSFAEDASYIVSGLAVIIPALAILWHVVRHNRSLLSDKRMIVSFAAFVLGLYAFLINASHFCDLCVMMFAVMLLLGELPLPSWNRYAVFVCVVLTAAEFAAGATRDCVKHSGIPTFFEFDGDRHVVEEGFFKGVHCGNVFVEVLKEEAGVVSKGGSYWFGPSMQWGYAAFNLPSPRGQPLFWEPGTVFAEKDEEMYFKMLLDAHYETLVFFKNCFTRYSQAELARLGEAYDVDQSLQALTVLHLKK